MTVTSSGPGLLVTAHASGCFSPHKPLAALETRAQVTLQNFISLPRVKNSWNGCCPELVLSASGPGRKNHAVNLWDKAEREDESPHCPSSLAKLNSSQG